MTENIYRQVKEAISAAPEITLKQLGVQLQGKTFKGDWISGNCVLCSDTNGSASYSTEGFLRCPQCSTKLDIFEWRMKRDGGDLWNTCTKLAGELGVEIPKSRKRSDRMPQKMTQKLLTESINNLASAAEAKGAREFLKSRGLDNAELLEKLGVGFLGGFITFAQFTIDGKLRVPYRCYAIHGKVKWTWRGGRQGATTGWWGIPGALLEPQERILVLEGEWDVMTALMRLELHEQGFTVVTWTGGAGAPVPGHRVPESWRGRPVHICYDNDTFQGPDWSTHRAPTDRKRLEMESRRRNFLDGIAGSFAANHCDVLLRVVPIDPLENFGADFRDWVDAGGRDVDDLPCIPWKECRLAQRRPVVCGFNEVYDNAGSIVDFHADVCTVDADGVVIPLLLQLQCDLGNKPCCKSCKAPDQFPDGVVDCQKYQRQLAGMLTARDPERHAFRTIIGKPNSCVGAELVPLEYVTGSRWTAISNKDDESGQRELMVISPDSPTLSGQVQVIGEAHHANGTVVVLADKLFQVEKAEVNLSEFKELKEMTPGRTDDIDKIDAYLDQRVMDLSSNVTKIHGRPDVHITHDLLMHSGIGLRVDDVSTRGWLDVAVIGDTRSGKSLTFRRLFEHHGLGSMHTCVENISRAGLTMGASGGQYGGAKLRPGLFPRQNRKALVLDEWHLMIEKAPDNPMLHLQSARDEGKVYGVKIYGSRSLPARVRLTCIGNWARGDRDAYRFACEHLLYLYGAPEMLSRCDFGLIVEGDPGEAELPECTHRWTGDLSRALILRAWAMDEERIRIDQTALELAKEQCEAWRGVYSFAELPIFTPEEKFFSVLRIAVAIANLVYSHPKDDEYSCEVRVVHVQWAINWLKRIWRMSGYEDYSKSMLSKVDIQKPFEAESMLTIKLGLTDFMEAANLLGQFLGRFAMQEICALTGKELHESVKWLSGLMRMNVVRKVRGANGWSVEYAPTRSGAQVLRNLIMLAEDYPHLWKRRYDRVSQWLTNGRNGAISELPITYPSQQLRDRWDDEPDDTQNLFEGPGAG